MENHFSVRPIIKRRVSEIFYLVESLKLFFHIPRYPYPRRRLHTS